MVEADEDGGVHWVAYDAATPGLGTIRDHATPEGPRHAARHAVVRCRRDGDGWWRYTIPEVW